MSVRFMCTIQRLELDIRDIDSGSETKFEGYVDAAGVFFYKIMQGPSESLTSDPAEMRRMTMVFYADLYGDSNTVCSGDFRGPA